MKMKLLIILTIAAVGSTCWFSAKRQIAKTYTSGFNDGAEAMLMHVLENEVHLGPIVAETGSTVSNLNVTVIVWPGDEVSGIRIESMGGYGSCYMQDRPPHTFISNNSFDFVSAWQIR